MKSEMFTNADGSLSHWSVVTLADNGTPVDVATGIMHSKQQACDAELSELLREDNGTMFDLAKALFEKGIYVGPRDPKRNTDFEGDFMACEDVNEGPTADAGRGGFCIVGYDLDDLIRDAYSHVFD